METTDAMNSRRFINALFCRCLGNFHRLEFLSTEKAEVIVFIYC